MQCKLLQLAIIAMTMILINALAIGVPRWVLIGGGALLALMEISSRGPARPSLSDADARKRALAELSRAQRKKYDG